MIGRLTGQLVDAAGNRGIVDVRGVGYELFSTARALQQWESEGEIVVHVSTQVREDAITLYGFPNLATRDTFETLLGISKVGPKVALATLDTLSPSELATAVANDDVITLSKIPGVGKKTAQRLALELKGKLDVHFVPTARTRTQAVPDDPLPLALARLGYTKTEIDRALAGLDKQGIAVDAETSQRLSAALRLLSGAS